MRMIHISFALNFKEDHKQLKLIACKHNESIKEFIIKSINMRLKHLSSNISVKLYIYDRYVSQPILTQLKGK